MARYKLTKKRMAADQAALAQQTTQVARVADLITRPQAF